MDKTVFENRKDKLRELVNQKKMQELSSIEVISLNKLLSLLDEYTFEQRIKVKGKISHVIVDSLELDSEIIDQFISFDKYIS